MAAIKVEGRRRKKILEMNEKKFSSIQVIFCSEKIMFNFSKQNLNTFTPLARVVPAGSSAFSNLALPTTSSRKEALLLKTVP